MLNSDPQWLVFLYYTCLREFWRALSVQQSTGAWVQIPAQLYSGRVIFAFLLTRKHTRSDDVPFFLLTDIYCQTDRFHANILCILTVFISLLSVFLPSLTIPVGSYHFSLISSFSYYSHCIYTPVCLPASIILIHIPRLLPFNSQVLWACLIFCTFRKSRSHRSNS